MTELYQAFKQVALRCDHKIAIASEHESYSYHTLYQQVERWAFTLAGLQQQPRLRIALLTEQAFNTAALAIAAAKLNGVCIPTNPQLTVAQLLTSWQATDVNMVVYEPAFAHKVTQCSTQLGESSIQFIAADIELDTHIADSGTQNDTMPAAPSDEFLITLSSGSTGTPKPIVLSQQVKIARAQQSWALYGVQQQDVVLCASPFFHSLGQRLFFVPLLLGATLVHIRQFTPNAWLKAVAQHQVSFVISVSSHLYALKDYLLSNAGQLQSLQTIVTSSAPIDSNFKAQLFNNIGCRFHEMYGATEVATASNLFPEFAEQKFATVGTPCPGVAITILDDNKMPVGVDSVGEIAVKSPLMFSGYYKQPELTANAIHQGYFLTGDLGKIAADGFLTYVGRKKDVIISGGINIYPKDIETALAKQAGIREVAVIGVEDQFLGEVILAICVPEPISDNRDGNIASDDANQKHLEQQLRRIANKQLAPFQRPLKYFFPATLPLTATGKISKLALREQYNALAEDWSAPLRAMFFQQ